MFDRRADGSWREGQYSVEPDRNCAVVLLFSSENGEPLAMLNDNWIQHMRVGGTAGLGTRLLARADAETACMIGSGGMAQTFLEGLCVVRPVRRVRVYSPSRGNREAYAALMSERLGITAEAVDDARTAIATRANGIPADHDRGPQIEASHVAWPNYLHQGDDLAVLDPDRRSLHRLIRFPEKITAPPTRINTSQPSS